MRFFTIAIFLLFNLISYSQGNYKPQTGDLLFQDIDCGEFCDAIEKVTTSVEGKSFSHIGIVSVEKNEVFVFEAIGRGVVKTSLDSFLARSVTPDNAPKVYAGRLKNTYTKSIPKAIFTCTKLLGSKYDDGFDITNNKYYCSELVYYAFTDDTGKSLFELFPMTFKDPSTHQYFPVWVKYFRELGIDIPEGKPGLNPGGISRSDKIQIIYKFY